MNKKATSTREEIREEGGVEMKPVLIVEDEDIMRESLRDWLKDEGYEVETAEEGEEALRRIGEKDFGVAVLDLRLPGKDGLEVLKEATAQNPKLKGIIITAYPSVETAVQAMKIGAVDYVVKPFAPDALEKSIEAVLGPAQVQIKPDVAKVESAVVEAPAVEEAKVEEIVPITEREIPACLRQGKDHFRAGHYDQAIREFQSILSIAPGHVGTRTLLRKAKEELAKPKVEVSEAEAAVEEEPKYCVWMSIGMVSYRICTNNYDCASCEFDQTMQEKMAAAEAPELDEALEKLKELPGPQRLCRYALKGDVSYRLCTRLFQCATCEFGQFMEDVLRQKLAQRAAELAAREDALHKNCLLYTSPSPRDRTRSRMPSSA